MRQAPPELAVAATRTTVGTDKAQAVGRLIGIQRKHPMIARRMKTYPAVWRVLDLQLQVSMGGLRPTFLIIW